MKGDDREMKKVTFVLMVIALTAALAISVAAPVSANGDPVCSYQICLTDDYGDGWNGGTVDVFVNAIPVYSGLTLATGSGPECHPISVKTGDEITVYYTPGGWAYENEYHIYDSDGILVRSEGTGGVEPGDVLQGELYGLCDGDPVCLYQICLTDDYDDGWNGGYVDVFVNAIPVYSGLTLGTGSGPECHPISVNTGDEITVDYTEGTWPYENEYHIYDSDGIPVRSEGTGGGTPGDVLPGELYGLCEYAPGCLYRICLTDDYGDGWNGGTVDVFVNAIPVYVGLTLATGSGPECHLISVKTGDEITVDYTPGGWSYENEYHIYDWDGILVRSEGTGGVEPGDVLPGELYGECECVPSIDIKPGSFPNSINLKSKGVIPVAILTTECFDALTVDPDTVIFAGAAPLRWAIEDVDYDGDLDIILHFKTQETGITAGDTKATLSGETFGGVPFTSTDSLKTVP